ncbi:MAG TPA: hypothetical protein VGK50_03675 [Coriobacteriia bacterium]|jgi:predicted CXXCH cytochrome family protein
MKKFLMIAALSLVLVFAFATVAMADTNSGYQAWNAGGANNGSLATPHKDYRLTTVKCSVCHAVHKATAAPAGEILLNATVANACVFCHIQAGAAGAVQVYNGVPANYTAANVQAHNTPCSGCHAVHGAGTINNVLVSQKILRMTTSVGGASYNPQAGTGFAYASATRANVISAFCTTCHPYWVGVYDGTHVGSLADATSYSGHIMKASGAAYANPHASVTAVVAYADSTYCTSCHDDGANIPANDFPHFTAGARFMKAATSLGAVDTTGAVSPSEDGACLKCHRDNGAVNGIGITF